MIKYFNKAHFFYLFSVLLSLNFLTAQQQYLGVDDIKKEWKDFTSFQRQELVGYTNFLYNEGFYERALLGYFQFLYKYPKDELETATYFQIAKSYEKMEDWDLAKNYYDRIIKNNDSNSKESKAAQYQILFIELSNSNYDLVLEKTKDSSDPYEMIFRAYAHFEKLEWENSRQSFKVAESIFDHNHYSKLIKPWYKAIKTGENAPLKKRTPALLSSLFPGGGFVYLDQKENAIGLIASTVLLYSAMISSNSNHKNGDIFLANNRQQNIPLDSEFNILENNPSASKNYFIPKSMSTAQKNPIIITAPILVALGLQFASGWKSVKDIDQANKRLVVRFTGRVTSKLSVTRFMDYPLPEFIIK